MLRSRFVTRRIPMVAATFALLIASGCAPEEDAEVAETSEDAPLEAQMAALLKKHPDAKAISDHEIAFDDGKVVLDLLGTDPDAPQDKATVRGCPSGWFCFYQHQNFGGRRLQFSDCTRGGATQWLRDYGFENQTTAWVVNRSVNFINVNDHHASPGYPSGKNLWNARSHSQSSNVGVEANDRADWFICYL